MERKKLFEIKELKTYFKTEAGIAKAVDGVSFDVYEGEVLGIVGESGSGKSVTSLSINRLIPSPPGFNAGGEVLYKGKDLLKLSYKEMRDYRGKDIAMIFQEPMTSLNPVFTIGFQMTEVILRHFDVSKEEAEKRSIAMLEKVGIPDPANRMKDYPHQYSGGMRQRVMIAMALLNNPALLIADEPTTALDVTIQAQILELMLEMKKERKEAAIMLITHDLAVVAETCERVIVMYGGKIQEQAEVNELFAYPMHPYTRGLLSSIPRPDREKQKRLQAIRGMVPPIMNMPKGCKFCTRCDEKLDICDTVEPELAEVKPGHFVRCHLYGKKNK
ncbi:MAG: peptide ABC transporter ATP-binding protein [Candidatus Cloacimonadota bacterium]|nr:MAG: peptide ABC transporter ATP-binding protein [Candidatus Cloacimonadota bacterium]PIE78232.1 MAG: peptide ABC transporter ATP-binding protein [Candidatus Delongbacteria bacterium]